ncbi:Phtf1 protein [Elysia marginata]|uniref:Phtf1 protein n=1 Tax=Elysia marginata TaxID=1093978 RepID=A0AAV4I0J1_9GAST|nr:Phtf1 protein [Elysia marginata]
MERVHDAIEWYQKKIGSYDKQLWEQSVEKKLQKQPEFVRQNAPRRKVRPKTEYIDVDLIRGSTFTKTKPQVPWVFVTKKALARVLFFPFYYSWWIHQTSGWGYVCLLCLYVLQVTSICVYVSTDDGLLEDELSFTEVVLPMILMFLLCLIHSQTTKQQDSGYTTVYGAKPSHTSLPCNKELGRQHSGGVSSATELGMRKTVAEEDAVLSRDCHQTQQNGRLTTLTPEFPSTNGVQPSSSLSSFSSTLNASKSQVTCASNGLFRPDNNTEEERLPSNHAALSDSYKRLGTNKDSTCFGKTSNGEVQILINGKQRQISSSKPLEINASSTPSCSDSSLTCTVLGNLPTTESSDRQLSSPDTGLDDSERMETITKNSTLEELQSETTLDHEHLGKFCTSDSNLGSDYVISKNGVDACEKFSPYEHTAEKTNVEMPDKNDDTPKNFASANSYEKSIENNFLPAVGSPSHLKAEISYHNRDVKCNSVVEHITPVVARPSSVDPKLSFQDPKLRHLPHSREAVKESRHVMSSAGSSSPDHSVSHETNAKFLTHSSNAGKVTPQLSASMCDKSSELSSVCTASATAASHSESIHKFSEYLVDKILSKETLRLKNFLSGENVLDSEMHGNPKEIVAHCRRRILNKDEKRYCESSSSLSQSLSSMVASPTKHGNKHSSQSLCDGDADASFDSAISSLPCGTSFNDMPKQVPRRNTSCLRTHSLQYAKDAQDESNASDEDDDQNVAKDLDDDDADDDDDGEDDGGVEGTDSDVEMDKSVRMKQLRFQEGLSDGKG